MVKVAKAKTAGKSTPTKGVAKKKTTAPVVKKVAKKSVAKKEPTAVKKGSDEVTKNKSHHLSKHPWEKWFMRKSPITITSKDYSATQNSMCVMLRQNAKKMNVKIKLKNQDDGSIVITPCSVSA